MNLNFYENLPETLSRDEVEALCVDFFKDNESFLSGEALEVVDILADKQWHTYTTPSVRLKCMVSEWLDKYCDSGYASPDVIMKVAYCFGLKKTFFEKVSKEYGGDVIEDYYVDLERSKGEDIDPYLSLKR